MNRILQKVLLFILFCICSTNLFSQLNGGYTINSAVVTGGNNYQTITEAVTALTTLGVTGPTTFTVAPGSGPYVERFVLTSIPGASATNSVRFNGNGQTVQFTPTATANKELLTLNAVSFVTIDSFVFKTLSTSIGVGAWVTGASTFDTISRCVFDLATVTGTSTINSNGIVIGGTSASPTTSSLGGTNIYVAHNQFKGATNTSAGYYYAAVVSAGNNINNTLIGNVFENFYVYGIYLGGATNNIKIINNEIHRSTKTNATTFYGIYVGGSLPGAQITGNKIHSPSGLSVNNSSTFYGMYLVSGSGTAASPIEINNNVIYNVNTGGQLNGIYMLSMPYTRLYHNTIHFSAGGTGTSAQYGLYLSSNSNTIVKNNNISIDNGNSGAIYGIYHGNTSAFQAGMLQRNNVYVNVPNNNNAYYCFYNGSNYTSLNTFRAAVPTLEINSISANPNFVNVATGNLMPSSNVFYGSGENLLTAVPTDILGVARNSQPTVGAFEKATVSNNDIEMVEKVLPNSVVCAATTPVSVSIRNVGGNNITTVNVNYSVNGVLQPAIAYTNTLNPSYTNNAPFMDTVLLTNLNLAIGNTYDIKVWTSNVNNGVDVDNTNDTITFSVRRALSSGTYTIDGAIATGGNNFQTIGEFTSVLNQFGICGPIVVNINPNSGPYTDALRIVNVIGVSAINTIKINGNGSAVEYNASVVAPHLLVIENTDYVKVDSINFKSTNTLYGWGAALAAGSDYDSITNCIFDLSLVANSNSSFCNGITISASLSSPTLGGTGGTYNYISNNKILGSTSTSSYYYGVTINTGCTNNTVVNNLIKDFNNYGIYISSSADNLIQGNEVTRSGKLTTTVAGAGIYVINSSPGTKLIGNKIHTLGGVTGVSSVTVYGIQYLTAGGTVANPGIIANNLLYNFNQNGSNYGLHINSSNNLRIYHNTFVMDVPLTTSSLSYGFYANGTQAATEFKNNIIYLTASGTQMNYGYYFNTATSLVATNVQRNNIYVSPTNYHSFVGANRLTLAALQAAYPTIEVGSLSIDPSFVNPAMQNYTPGIAALNLYQNGQGLTAVVPTDINAKIRDVQPTPGAFEMDPPANDNAAALGLAYKICEGNSPVHIVIRNAGTLPLDSVRVYWSVNGVAQPLYMYTGPLNSGVNDTVLVGSYNFTGLSTIKGWTSMPNGNIDLITSNDTFEVTVMPALNGVYTINSALATSGTNFNKISDFTDALTAKGVCGPVVANIVPGSGPYVERVNFGLYNGVSDINTVTLNGNGNVVQYDAQNTSELPLLTFNAAQYIKVNEVKFVSLNAANGWGALFTGASQMDTLVNCEFDMSSIIGTSSVTGNGIVFSGSATSPSTTAASIAKNCYVGYNVVKGITSSTNGIYYGFISNSGTDSNTIIGNEFANFYIYGMNISNGNANKILNNIIHRAQKISTTTFYGINSTGVKAGTVISGNIVHSPGGVTGSTGTSYPYFLSSTQGTLAAPMIFSNNIVYNNNQGGTVYALYGSSASYTKIYSNTFVFDAPLSATTNYGMYFTGTHTGSELKNNIVSFTQGGTSTKYGYYFATLNAIAQADIQRNNIHMGSTRAGTQYHSYFGGNRLDLTALQTAYPAIEVGSLSIDPLFANVATGNLKPTIGAFPLYANGLNLSVDVPTDIVGVTRPANPTPGAFQMDEIVANNVSPIALLEPTGYCAGTHNFKVVVANEGSNTVDSLRINWSVNGVTQAPFYYVNALQSLLSNNTPTRDTVVIGSATIPNGVSNVVVWTSHPNGGVDLNTANDTLVTTVESGMSGNYTVNQSLPLSVNNFHSVAAVAEALNVRGVCGPVVVNVAPGGPIFYERLYLGNIANTSAINTVTINGNGNALHYSGSIAEPHLVKLTGTSFVSIDGFTFKSTNASYGWGALITEGASSDSIKNCVFDLSVTTSTSTVYSNGITFTGSATSPTTTATNIANDVYIGNNTFQGPTSNNGMYYAATVMQGANNIIFDGNTFADYYLYGMYLGNTINNLTIKDNTFHRANKTAVTTFYAIYSSGQRTGNTIVSGNRIYKPGGTAATATSTFYGIYFLTPNTTVNDTLKIFNNAIYDINQGGTVYPLYVSAPGANLELVHNTIHSGNSYTGTYYGIYVTGSSANGKMQNNLVTLPSSGTNTAYGYYLATTSGIPQANVQRNNVWLGTSPSATFYHSYHGGNRATLNALTTAYPLMEQGSLSVDPQFVNVANGNLGPTNALLHNNGLNWLNSVPVDINTYPRNSNPTVGAFEKPLSQGMDGYLVEMLQPELPFCAGVQNVSVDVTNFGNQQMSNFNINWSLNGVLQTPYNYSGILDTFGGVGAFRDTVVLGSANFTYGTQTIRAWLNIANDVQRNNDTVTKSINLIQYVLVPEVDTICIGADIDIEINPNSGFAANTLQWQSSNDGITYTNVTGAVTAEETFNLNNNTYFRVEMTLGGTVCYSDTLMIVAVDPAIQTYNDVDICGPGPAQLNATVNPGIEINWYDDETSNTPIFSGATLDLPFVLNTDTFYVAGGRTTPGGGTAAAIMPSHGSNFTGNVRGMWFTAPSNFTITSLEAGSPSAGSQNIAVVKFTGNIAPPTFGLTTNAFTVLYLTQNNPAVGPINVSIPVASGEVIGILSSKNNITSYSAAIAPQNLVVDGNNIVINRLGMQFPLNTTAPQDLWNEANGNVGLTKFTYETSSSCESPRVPVIVNVRALPEVDLGPDIDACVDVDHLEFLNARNPGNDYLWDNAYNGQVRVVDASGTYHVTVTNSFGCQDSDTINVNFKRNPVVNLGNDTLVCNNVSLPLDAGAGGVSYIWNTGATTQKIDTRQEGLYFVNVVGENGCVGADSIVIRFGGNAPNHSGIWARNTVGNTFAFQLINPLSINSYEWDFGDGTPISRLANPTHTYANTGNYIVRLNTFNTCGSRGDTVTVHVFSSTGLADLGADWNLKLFPNPTKESVSVKVDNDVKIQKVVLLSSVGQVMHTQEYNNKDVVTLDVSHLTSAMYHVQIHTNKGVATRKLDIIK